MRWPPWPPLLSKKFEVIIVLRRLQGLDLGKEVESGRRLRIEMKWKGGQKGMALGSLRRSVKRNFTKESEVGDDGVVDWDEEFRSLCNFSGPKEGLFYPWELTFTVFTVSTFWFFCVHTYVFVWLPGKFKIFFSSPWFR